MNGHDDLPEAKAEGFRGSSIENLVDILNLDEVVTRAQGAELIEATLTGALADAVGFGPEASPPLFAQIDICLSSEAALCRPAGPLDEKLIELVAPQS